MVKGEARAARRQYENFAVAVYIPVGITLRLADPKVLAAEWETIRSQLRVDKVYIESQRDRTRADGPLLETLKAFFLERGVKVAGGLTFSDGGGGQFRSFCYTDPADRAYVKEGTEIAARHFDEIILDDFFFVTTKYASDIAAKGTRTWTQFRMDLMNEAAESLVIGPARAVNPKVKVVIKYPNWYEHFPGLGFDLDKGPRLFDGIYTGTETRDPVITDQFLQSYESYQVFRYLENVKPGGNGGGWVDTFSLRTIDRYAEQLWDTLLAKPPEITLFNWHPLVDPVPAGERHAWEALPTSFDYKAMLAYRPTAEARPAEKLTMARVAGYSLDQIDRFLGKLGRPIGVASYRPYHATGEDYLHNYVGMIGIPIDLHPTFPGEARTLLLTEAAKSDPAITDKIKKSLGAGAAVVITSGLLRALRGKGIEDILEVAYTEKRIVADGYSFGFGAGNRTGTGKDAGPPILFPQVRFLTNDSWALVSAMADDVGFPLLLMNRYDKGILYVWTLPDNFHHLYRLPVPVASAIRKVVLGDLFVRMDGPGEVALFAYDNDTFVVQSFRDAPAEVRLSLTGQPARLKNLVTGAAVEPKPDAPVDRRRRSADEGPPRREFDVTLQPHSYAVFAAEGRTR